MSFCQNYYVSDLLKDWKTWHIKNLNLRKLIWIFNKGVAITWCVVWTKYILITGQSISRKFVYVKIKLFATIFTIIQKSKLIMIWNKKFNKYLTILIYEISLWFPPGCNNIIYEFGLRTQCWIYYTYGQMYSIFKMHTTAKVMSPRGSMVGRPPALVP